MASYDKAFPQGRRRVVVIGIDGATFDVMLPLAQAGRLPNLQRLMERGCWAPLQTTYPPVTAPAWTSFMTGVNPGKHGLFNFRYRKPGTYDLATNSSATNHSPMLWEILGQHGLRSCVLNVPMTYPPRPFAGECVTGLLTPANAEIITHPPELTALLHQAIPGYAIWPLDMQHPAGREQALMQTVDRLADLRVRLFQFMQGRGDWDFQMIVFMGVDQVQHAMWHYRDPSHTDYPAQAPEEFRRAIDTAYIRTDQAIGRILDDLGSETTVVVMSDHGFGPLEGWFHVNTWLLSEGLLALKPDPLNRLKHLLFRLGLTPFTAYALTNRLRLNRVVSRTTQASNEGASALLRRLFLSLDDVDWSKTVAYSAGITGPISLNLAGREPQGCVLPEQADAVLQDIASRLRRLIDPATGGPLVTEIVWGREQYHGPYADQGPDLLYFLREGRVYGFSVAEFASHRLLSAGNGRTGWHRMQGVFIAAGPGIRAGGQVFPPPHMYDVAPSLLALLGVPVPMDMDGRPLAAVLDEYVLSSLRFADPSELATAPRSAYTKQEEALVAEQLKGLGYL